ncbi:CoA-transferase [Nocardioides carbamazepini]|uniref:CoA-transferase n=1 Tax=Nocardioides carbamazepini TaxID=2854259 RepID=UPI002149AA54|nr:CoA-transferase [Nocardioides carbamazepini]
MRAADIAGLFTPTGVGTLLAEGKETRTIDGRDYVLELPIRRDVALITAHRSDRMGKLVHRKAARNFDPSWPPPRPRRSSRSAVASRPVPSTPRTSSSTDRSALVGASHRMSFAPMSTSGVPGRGTRPAGVRGSGWLSDVPD